MTTLSPLIVQKMSETIISIFSLQSGFPCDVGQYVCIISISSGESCGTAVALNEDSFYGYFSVNSLYLLYIFCTHVPSVKLKETVNMFHT
jgi:hypothetical protein